MTVAELITILCLAENAVHEKSKEFLYMPNTSETKDIMSIELERAIANYNEQLRDDLGIKVCTELKNLLEKKAVEIKMMVIPVATRKRG